MSQLAGQVAALPSDYLSFGAVNPTSADAMRAIDAQMEMRVKDKLTDNGEDLGDVMRLILRLQTGQWDPRAETLETVWADPGTPTAAQKMDAAVKGVAGKIIPVEQAREDLGYSVEARKRMAAMDQKNSLLAITAGLSDQFGQGSAPARADVPTA
jgi:hypothetical protein